MVGLTTTYILCPMSGLNCRQRAGQSVLPFFKCNSCRWKWAFAFWSILSVTLKDVSSTQKTSVYPCNFSAMMTKQGSLRGACNLVWQQPPMIIWFACLVNVFFVTGKRCHSFFSLLLKVQFKRLHIILPCKYWSSSILNTQGVQMQNLLLPRLCALWWIHRKIFI